MTEQDRRGDSRSLFVSMGASNHAQQPREQHDFYATEPRAIDALRSKFDIPHVVLEPACGQGHLAERLRQLGHKVYASDKIDRGYGEVRDFFLVEKLPDDCRCVLTNPPYRYATDFILHALEMLPRGGYCVMFLKTIFLESSERYERLYRTQPPIKILQYVRRANCARNGDFDKYRSSAVSYAWFIWQKGNTQLPTIDWIHRI